MKDQLANDSGEREKMFAPYEPHQHQAHELRFARQQQQHHKHTHTHNHHQHQRQMFSTTSAKTSGHTMHHSEATSQSNNPQDEKLGPLARALPIGSAHGCKFARAKQRKWRVLVSIGLLLPALAAIIGIVAWSVSIEVATSDHHRMHHSHRHQRLHAHLQQQQQQQQQQESRLSDSLESRTLQARQQQQQPALMGREEAVASVARRTARAQQSSSQPAQQQQQQQQQQQDEPRGAPQPVAAAVMAAETLAASERKPNNEDNNEKANESKDEAAERQDRLAYRRSNGAAKSDRTLLLKNFNQLEATNGERAELRSQAQIPEQTFSEPKLHRVSSRDSQADEVHREAEQNEDIQSNDQHHQPCDENKDSSQRAQSKEGDDGLATITLDSTGDKQHQHRARSSWISHEAEEPKSVLFDEKKRLIGLSSSSKIKSATMEEKENLKLASARLAKTRLVAGKTPKQLQSNKYTLTEAAEKKLDQETPVDVASRQPANQNEEPQTEQDEPKEMSGDPIKQPDDDISFEQIASAISSTLNQEAQESQLNDSDELPGDVQQQKIKRRRTTGEHVAEVIDHLVDRHKQQQQQQQQQQQTEQQPSQMGPQVVVVAPIGAHGAHMRARSLTKETTGESATTDTKKAEPQVSKDSAQPKRQRKALGARLLGVGAEQEGQKIKYSERVEVIEDDDSSALLTSADQQERNSQFDQISGQMRAKAHLDLLFPSTSHVSSHSGEPRLRSPRHFYQGESERFGGVVAQPPVAQLTNLRQVNPPRPAQQAKLYSAEQLIRDHVLKSRQRVASHSSDEQQQRDVSQEQRVKVVQVNSTKAIESVNNKPPTTTETSPQETTPAAPTITIGAQQSLEVTQKPEQLTKWPQASLVARQQEFSRSRQQQHQQHQSQQPQQQQQQQQGRFTPGFRTVQVPTLLMAASQQQSHYQRAPFQHQQTRGEPLEIMESQQLQQVGPAQQQQQQQQQQLQHSAQVQPQEQVLPVFQDQEIQVPAHMAESVIQNLQRTPTQVTGYLNGRSATFQAFMGGQQPAHFQQASAPFALFAPMQQQQQQQFNVMSRPMAQQFYLPTGAQQHAMPWFSQLAVATRRAQEHSQQAQQTGTHKASSSSANANSEPESLIGKTLGQHALSVQPIAQRAIRNLLTSFGHQAAEQQSQLEAVSAGVGSAPTRDASQELVKQSADPMQAAGSAPEPGEASENAGTASRSMRSLPIGARAPASSKQHLQMINDQDVAESYNGPMPSYYMNGGGGYQQPYQNEHDKKTKGVTFHFGGGPIGGGTQLITSPMGIFKNLMIPLMPNPRVNLNGKVVFGVVLEKSTAFGPPPKKKYKFWG